MEQSPAHTGAPLERMHKCPLTKNHTRFIVLRVLRGKTVKNMLVLSFLAVVIDLMLKLMYHYDKIQLAGDKFEKYS